MPAMVMQHEIDPREALIKSLGNLDDVDIFNNQILVAVYQRGANGPKKTTGGIFLPDQHLEEDRFQSKVGVIVKMGESAFHDASGVWFKGIKFNLGDWVVYRASDGWSLSVNKVLCRLLDDTVVRARIQHPDMVW
jgi:co-chaperonin GroES (HSP10)